MQCMQKFHLKNQNLVKIKTKPNDNTRNCSGRPGVPGLQENTCVILRKSCCLECAVHIHLNSGLHFMIYSWYSCLSDRPIFSFIPTCDAPMNASRKGPDTKPNHLLTVLCCDQHSLPSQNNSVIIHSKKKKKHQKPVCSIGNHSAPNPGQII